MLNNAHVFNLIPEYALGSLEEEDTRHVTEHLAGCSVCREELAAYQKVADRLLLAVPEQTPSVELKARLKERIHQLAKDASRPVETKRSAQPSRWRIPQRLIPVGTFAGLLVILLLAISNLMLWQRLNRLEVISGPLGMRAIVLQNTSAALDASAFVVMGADGENGVLVVDHLPPLKESQEYQVWLVKDGVRTSGGTFAVDEDGYRGLRLEAPESLLTYSDVYVTVEPAGGSAEPTGTQVLMGSLFNP
jgi:anti-sigma-K factor RskA